MSEEFEVTERSRVRLFGNRGSHRKDDVYAAIDSSLYGTVAYSIGDQPYATPTMIWRQGDYIYWHGSAGSRMLRTVARGRKVSVTFVHVDGFVLSRLASAHAMNYRSVMVFGNAEPVVSLDERREQLKFFLSRLFPGRWDEVKQPSLDELNAIIMVRMRIQEGSLKKRAGLPGDGRPVFGGEALYEQACWAGTLPISTCAGFPQDALRLKENVVIPSYISNFGERFGMAAKAEDKIDSILAEVVEVRRLACNVRWLRLKPETGRFPSVKAGAHIQIGVLAADRTRDYRHYSIVNSDSEGGWYEIAVLRQIDGRGGSRYLHDEIECRQTLVVRPPENDFPLDADAEHSILIAGGIGITPIFAMARELDRLGRSAEVHYSAKGSEHVAFLDDLHQLKNVTIRFYDTASGSDSRIWPDDILGTYQHGRHVYVCGPHGLIADTLASGARLGYPKHALHSEAFAAPAPSSTDVSIDVKFARTGKSVAVDPGQSILDVALAEGIAVSHSCKRGECGLCTTAVVKGHPDHRDRFLTAEERNDNNKMCICVSWARTPSLVLDL